MSRPTRELLVDAAESLLDEGGVDAVTLREVGRRSGVSHNAPYKHFASKEALLAAVAARELRRSAESRSAECDRPADDRLRDGLHRSVSRAVAHPNRFRLIYGQWPADVAAELIEAAHDAYQALIGLVIEAQRTGALPAGAEPERLASLLRSTVQGAADLAISGHLARDGKGRAATEDVIDDLLANLKP
jgi:AcrR family transcriptional regulator